MLLSVLDQYGMCSTITLSSLYGFDTVEGFCKHLRQAIDEEYNGKAQKEIFYDSWSTNKNREESRLRGLPVEDHAIVIATVVSEEEFGDEEEEVIEAMQKFGFIVSKKQYWNDKNDTYIKLLYMGATEMMKTLEKFEEQFKKKAA